MAGNIIFYYFGDDEVYYKTLVAEFSRSSKLVITFRKIFESDENRIQSLFLNVFRERPHCVFIDFSKLTVDYLHLARILARNQSEQKFITVGLVDYLSPPEVLTESIATGVTLTHIKSAESFDVVFDVAYLISPTDTGEHGFAKATLKDDYEAGIPGKIGYIHNEGVHVETDFRLQKGDRIKANHFWTKDRIVPSKEMFVQDVSSKNLFYHFQNGVDLEFIFVDEFLPPEGMEPETIAEKKKEREDLILNSRKQLSRWLADNESRSKEKRAKVLVIDRQFHFYDNQQRTDKHDYTIRCLPYFNDISADLDRFEPQVIAFALEPDTATEPKNTNESLVQLMRTLREKYPNPDESPFVVIFSCPAKSQDFQNQFQYSHVMTTNLELDVALMVRMAEMFNKKLEAKINRKKNNGRLKVHLNKSNPATLMEILIPITILKLSETDMLFQCDKEIPTGMNLHLTSPTEMHVHVQPAKAQGKVPEYYGLIHGLGEQQKKELRKFVNTVFFRDHDAQLQAETDEFKKLNEAKMQEKEQEKQQEEQEAKTEEKE